MNFIYTTYEDQIYSLPENIKNHLRQNGWVIPGNPIAEDETEYLPDIDYIDNFIRQRTGPPRRNETLIDHRFRLDKKLHKLMMEEDNFKIVDELQEEVLHKIQELLHQIDIANEEATDIE